MSDTELIMDEQIVRVGQPSLVLAPVMDLRLAKQRLSEFQEFVHEYLRDGEDFGIIPGTPKPTLYKSGADKLCELYGLSASYTILSKVEDFDRGLFDYTIECVLVSRVTGQVVSSGLGCCSRGRAVTAGGMLGESVLSAERTPLSREWRSTAAGGCASKRRAAAGSSGQMEQRRLRVRRLGASRNQTLSTRRTPS